MSADTALSSVPTIKELYDNVITEVSSKWEDLAICLELKGGCEKICAIRRDFVQHGVQKCCLQALHHWLRGEGKQPVNWVTLLRCLRDIECANIATRIKDSLLKKNDDADTNQSNDVYSVDASLIVVPSLPPPSTERYNLFPAIREELRDYQWELALPGLSGQNYIICAPTGSGKTRVAGLIISEHLKQKRGMGKVVFVVNKVPLVQQQRTALQHMMQQVKMEEVSGNVSQYKKAMLTKQPCNNGSTSSSSDDSSDEEGNFHTTTNDIIVCTAGCLKNELNSGKVDLSMITLMVIDECHNTRKKSDYAKIMHLYIKGKGSGNTLPQIVGLTATPGAGDASRPTLQTVYDHLLSFCASMDAYGGIKTVTKNIPELKSSHVSPMHTQCVVQDRNDDEEFIATISYIISQLEALYKLKPPPGSKWKDEYVTWVNTQLHSKCKEMSGNRDIICTLKMAKCLSRTLSMYLNLQFEDAMSILREFTLPCGKEATAIESNLLRVFNDLYRKLESFERVDNPLLLQVEDILVKQFEKVPKSKAIIFVETKNQATGLCTWIQKNSKLRSITSEVVTGQTRDTGKKMTIAEQTAALDGFRRGEVNLLVSTSVLEEGIDIPACNLVLKYQKVTSDVAEVQSKGRARASHSQSFTIVSSDSGKEFQELLNEEKRLLVEQILEVVPTGELLLPILKSKQEEIMKEVEMQQMASKQKKKQYSPLEVELHCSHCSAFLCNGSDVHTIPDTSHYVVTAEDFKSWRAEIIEHHKPHHEPHGLSRTHKLRCHRCKVQEFGVIGRWWKSPQEYPVLKCAGIKFVINSEVILCKQWKNAPFEVTSIK